MRNGWQHIDTFILQCSTVLVLLAVVYLFCRLVVFNFYLCNKSRLLNLKCLNMANITMDHVMIMIMIMIIMTQRTS